MLVDDTNAFFVIPVLRCWYLVLSALSVARAYSGENDCELFLPEFLGCVIFDEPREIVFDKAVYFFV